MAKFRCRTSLLAMVMGWWLAALGAAAEGRYCVVDGWGTGEGLLPQSAIISMTQTRDGYLWLATRNGLARFDGLHFSVFDESTTPKLSSIQTVKLFEDSRSNLWIGTESAGAMLVTNGQILKLAFGEGKREGHLVSICEDSLGCVWMLTKDGDLARYSGGIVDVWKVDVSSLVGGSVIAEKSGLVWVGTSHGMMGFDPLKVRSKEALPQPVTMPVAQLDFLLASKSGGYWRIADGRIAKFSGTALLQDMGPCPWPLALVPGQNPVKAACEDRAGNLVVGCTSQGVYWFDAQGHFSHVSTTNGLANDSVLSLVVDSEGSLWVGMDGGGKSQHPLNRITRSIFNVVEPTLGQTVQSISEDNAGRIWFSAKNNDFGYWNNGVTNIGSSFGTLSRYNPRAIMVDTNQTVWAATMGADLFRLEDNQFRPAPGVGAFNHEISALYQGHDGRLWIGTQGGLGCWNGTNWQTFNTSNGLSANIIRAIADDAAGTVWVGTEEGGLNRMAGGKVTSFQKTNGFPSDNISCLYLDESGVLWVGTIGNGLVRLEQGQWKHYSTQNGLTGNSIDYLAEDAEGYLWIGSNDGLMRVKKKDLNDFDPSSSAVLACRGYDVKDGLPATECTYGSQPAACRARDGTLWFPTIAGMVSVNPAEIQPNTNPPPVVIESVLIDQRLQNTNGLRVAALRSVTLPAGQENLEIHYASLNLAGAGRTLFRYQLEGYQTKMSPPGKDRFARYPNLPHGTYQFIVQARNEDGFWSEPGASLEVIVLPPFWKTWWFRVGLVCALLGIVVATVHFISTQKLQRQLSGMRQQQALEKERARIARDIHDQVGASLTQLSLLAEMVEAGKANPAETEIHARQISQTARETAHELDEIVWTVNPSNDTLDGLVNYICKHAQEYLAVAGLRYRLDVPAHLPAVAITPEARHNIFLAAKESVTNVVKHARATEAWIRLRLGEGHFTLEIEDNGRGPEGRKEKAAESRNGLRNMRRRMEDIGGEFFIGPGPQGGTLVRLTVPLRNN